MADNRLSCKSWNNLSKISMSHATDIRHRVNETVAFAEDHDEANYQSMTICSLEPKIGSNQIITSTTRPTYQVMNRL